MVRITARLKACGALSSVGRASRLHRRNSPQTLDRLSMFGRTERDSMANIEAPADHLRTTLPERDSDPVAHLRECADALDFIIQPSREERDAKLDARFGKHLLDFIGRDKPWESYGRVAVQLFRPAECCVYFIGGDVGAIKIGISKAPLERLSTMQTGSPIPLSILALAVGSLKQERDYHQRFSAHRLHNEWFAPHPDILAQRRTSRRRSSMTTTHTTQAARRCADLANAGGMTDDWVPNTFLGGSLCFTTTFRREVERIDAMIREVLACLTNLAAIDSHDDVLLQQAKTLLRENLLPDPEPTLLEEFMAEHPLSTFNADAKLGVSFALDWIAKRQEKEA